MQVLFNHAPQIQALQEIYCFLHSFIRFEAHDTQCEMDRSNRSNGLGWDQWCSGGLAKLPRSVIVCWQAIVELG